MSDLLRVLKAQLVSSVMPRPRKIRLHKVALLCARSRSDGRATWGSDGVSGLCGQRRGVVSVVLSSGDHEAAEEIAGHPFAVSIITKGCRADVQRITEVLEQTGWDIKKAEEVLLEPEAVPEDRCVQDCAEKGEAADLGRESGTSALVEDSDSHPREWPNEIGRRSEDVDVIMCEDEERLGMTSSQVEAGLNDILLRHVQAGADDKKPAVSEVGSLVFAASSRAQAGNEEAKLPEVGSDVLACLFTPVVCEWLRRLLKQSASPTMRSRFCLWFACHLNFHSKVCAQEYIRKPMPEAGCISRAWLWLRGSLQGLLGPLRG